MPKHLPHPDHLGPDPEPYGTERFLHAIGARNQVARAGPLTLAAARDTRDDAPVSVSHEALAA